MARKLPRSVDQFDLVKATQRVSGWIKDFPRRVQNYATPSGKKVAYKAAVLGAAVDLAGEVEQALRPGMQLVTVTTFAHDRLMQHGVVVRPDHLQPLLAMFYSDIDPPLIGMLMSGSGVGNYVVCFGLDRRDRVVAMIDEMEKNDG